MTRIIRPLTFLGLFALVMSVGPTTADANGFGLFGPRQTTYISPVETIYSMPIATSYVVPTTSIVSSSYLVPTSSVVYRPTTYLAPTIYRSSATLLPTSYVVGSSFLRPTRYYVGDVIATSSVLPTSVVYRSSVYPSSIVYPSTSIVTPSRIVYDAPVIESAPPIYVDRPANSSNSSGRPAQSEPPLSNERSRSSESDSTTGRSPTLESRPLDPDPVPAPRERDIELESPPPPDIPLQPEEGSINDLDPLPSGLFDETRESLRPTFAGSVPGSTLAAATRSVQGRVRDTRSGRPISGAVVSFSNTLASFGERRAVTNDRGEFRLEFIPDGDWSIIISGQNEEAPTRTYPQITVLNGRIFDRGGRDYSKLLLDY